MLLSVLNRKWGFSWLLRFCSSASVRLRSSSRRAVSAWYQPPRHADGDADAHDQHVEQGVTGEEAQRLLPGPHHRRTHRVRRQHVAEEQVHADHDRTDEQQVPAQKPADAPRGEVAVDQQQVVRIEDHHEREGHDEEAPVLRAAHQRPVGIGHEERHAEDHGPDREVDEPPGVFRLQRGHNAKVIKNCRAGVQDGPGNSVQPVSRAGYS